MYFHPSPHSNPDNCRHIPPVGRIPFECHTTAGLCQCPPDDKNNSKSCKGPQVEEFRMNIWSSLCRLWKEFGTPLVSSALFIKNVDAWNRELTSMK